MEANGTVTSSQPTTAVPDQRTLALMNIYVANTTQAVNEVAGVCERKVHDVDRRCVQNINELLYVGINIDDARLLRCLGSPSCPAADVLSAGLLAYLCLCIHFA
jgi:hypothetical protein